MHAVSRTTVRALVLATAWWAGPGSASAAPPIVVAAPGAPAAEATGLFPVEAPAARARRHLDAARRIVAGARSLAKECPPRALEAWHAGAAEAWNALWTCPGAADVVAAALPLYDEALAGLLTSAAQVGRADGAGIDIGPRAAPRRIPIALHGLAIEPATIQGVVVGPPPADHRIGRSLVRPGFGVPVSLRLATDDVRFDPPRRSIAATAVLRFPLPREANFFRDFVGPLGDDPPPAVLDLVDPVEVAAVRIGPARPHVAADLTAPLLDMLEATPSAGIEGFLQPYGRGDTAARLELLEPHRRGRIPVVFIHGLASDPGTWFDLLNELRAWPEFHRRFEPWLFQYPTGATFLRSAAVLRAELAAARRAVDPGGSDPALDRIVLVGHSMGGLHAKLQVVDPGTSLWDAVSTQPFATVRMPPSLRRETAPTYFFAPAPFVRRVVFVATPHAGSSLAARAGGRLASVTVRQPPESLRAHAMLRDANPDAIRPEYRAAPPTTVDILEPNSSILQAVRALRPSPWVSLHTILGDGAVSPLEGPGDAVVSVGSARHPDVVSELAVPAIHTRVHHHPRAVLEMRRILECHLAESGHLVAATETVTGAAEPPGAPQIPDACFDPVSRIGPANGAVDGAIEAGNDLHPAVSAPVVARRWPATVLPRR